MRLGSVVWLLPLFFALAAAQFGLQNVLNLPKNVGNSVKDTVSGAFQPQNYREFFTTYGKAAWSEAEKKVHEAEYLLSQQLVDLTNAGKKGYTLGMNAFAAVTNAEFLKFFTGNSKSASGESKASADRQEAAPPTTKVPDAFDWRTKGGVTPVKFQDECGSCWAFATTGAIEGHVYRKTNKLPNLSEQNLIDCGPLDYGLNGCDGGYQEYAFAFIKDQQKGVQNSNTYAYANKQDKCKYNAANKEAEIKGFAAITPKDEKTMKKAVATLGPLACSMNAKKSLLLYKDGIYADDECNKGEVNHAVLVVGYGSENGKDYWIVKNSWDKEWGEGGYFRLPRGSNYCGIAVECSYPIV